MTTPGAASDETRRPPDLYRRAPLLLAGLVAASLVATFAALDSPGKGAFDAQGASAASRDGDRMLARLELIGAFEAYSRAIALDHRNAQAFYGRGLARAQTGDPAGAAHDFRTALLLRHDFRDARVARAAVRVQEGDLQGAFAEIREALKHEPDSWQLHLQLGGLQGLTGDRDASVAEYSLAADILDGQGLKTLAGATRQLIEEQRPSQPAKPPEPGDIVAAERALVALYVDEPDYADLLQSAWSTAAALVRSAGVPVPPELEPRLGVPQNQAEANTLAAFGALTRTAGGVVSRDDIVLGAIEGMARSLKDNHTGFVRPDLWQKRQAGATFGVGIHWVDYQEGAALVRRVVDGSPAAKAGIRAGDVIWRLDGAGDPADFFSPPATSPITVTVERRSSRFEVELTPGSYQAPLIDARLLEGHIGYVSIASFPPHLQAVGEGRTFLQYLDGSIRELRGRGATRWVLDLRGNPGGAATTGSLVAARFGLKGLVSEFHARAGRVSVNSALGPNLIGDQPLAVLIDGHSASMAEVLAQALQDARRARVFGVVSAGKVNGAGVQQVAGGALEITLARIRSGPLRADIDNEGVQPDESVALERDGLAAGSDSQLAAAVRYLMSRRSR